jgi:putative transcriptional regulator
MTTKGRIDVAKVRSATEADKARWDVEDGFDERDFGPERLVLPKTDVRALRERLALSQEAFSERYFLPLRTVQDWEQRRREPSEPARVLLYAIDRDAKAVEAILAASSAGQRGSSRRVSSPVASASRAPAKPTKRRKSA